MPNDNDPPNAVPVDRVADSSAEVVDAAPVGDGAANISDVDTSAKLTSEEERSAEPDSLAVGVELTAMASALERFHSRAEQYESIIRRMQSRIEELQSDQVRELLKPVIVKLASLHTEATEAKDRAVAREDDSARKDFDYFASEIEEALSLLEIESIGASPLDEFVATRHAARRRIDTEDAMLDRKIAKVLRQGFTFVGAERVFLPAMVNVYRHTPQEQADSPTSTEIIESAK